MSAQEHAGDFRVYPAPADVAAAVADAFVEDARAAIEQRGAFNVALAGGTTPKAAYQLLAREPRAASVDWRRVFVYFGDERCVPPESDESNYKMAREAFLDRTGIPKENVHRIAGEDDPLKAARDYAEDLVESLGELPTFDLVLLGMGTDGHTASLFPGTDPRTDEELLVRAPYVEKMNAYRVTLTPSVINQARHVLIATEGLPKAPALYAVLKGPHDPQLYPIQIVRPAAGRLTWCVDEAAAAQLTTT